MYSNAFGINYRFIHVTITKYNLQLTKISLEAKYFCVRVPMYPLKVKVVRPPIKTKYDEDLSQTATVAT